MIDNDNHLATPVRQALSLPTLHTSGVPLDMASTEQPTKSRSLVRWGVSIILCLLALAGGGLVFQTLAGLKEDPQQNELAEKVYKVDVFDVQRSNLRELISGFGTSQAYREVVLSAEVGGVVVEKHPQLKPGSHVDAAKISVDKQGRTNPTTPALPLLRIDPENYQQRVTQAKARIAEVDAEIKVLQEQDSNNELLVKKAMADVEVYEREFKRIEDLGKRGVTSKTELTATRLELERYKQAVLNMENERRLFPVRLQHLESRRDTLVSDLETARLDLARTEIHPPFSGVLSEVMVEQGQNLRPGDELVKILDLDVIEIPIPLSLSDYEKIAALFQAGTRPKVSLAPNTTSPAIWNGHIERISPQADESTRTVDVYIRVENSEQPVPLLPGTFVHARIEGPLIEGALVVPRDCIVDDRVYLAKDNRAVKQLIVSGQTLQSLALIEEGLSPGDQIIMTNLDILDDQSLIEIRASKTLADELKLMQVKLVVPQ